MIVLGLAVGFLLGTLVDYPKANQDNMSGTIRKIDNYRNAKATEADIRLQNTLVSDTLTLIILQNYITYHYLDAIKMSGDIDVAVAEANAVEAFKTSGKSQIDALAKYGLYLSASRLYFLTAMAVSKDPKNTEPALVRNALNQVNNIIAQKNYRNRSVLEFIGQVESFLGSSASGDYSGLKKAHDLLAVNMVHASVVTGDKVMQKFLGKQALISGDKKLNWYDPTQTMKQVKQDIEKLGSIADAEKLSALDAEKLNIADAEKLSLGVIVLDAAKLGALDAEKLNGCVLDVEKLGYFLFVEQLGKDLLDGEKLGFLDAEKLSAWDAEKLNTILDAQRLGIIMDAEQMGVIEID